MCFDMILLQRVLLCVANTLLVTLRDPPADFVNNFLKSSFDFIRLEMREGKLPKGNSRATAGKKRTVVIPV